MRPFFLLLLVLILSLCVFGVSPVQAAETEVTHTQYFKLPHGFTGEVAEFFGIKWGERIENIEEKFIAPQEIVSAGVKYSVSYERIGAPIYYGPLKPQWIVYGFTDDRLVTVKIHVTGPDARRIVYDELKRLYGPGGRSYPYGSDKNSYRYYWTLYEKEVDKGESHDPALSIRFYARDHDGAEGTTSSTVDMQFDFRSGDVKP